MSEDQISVGSEHLREVHGLVEAALENARSLLAEFTPTEPDKVTLAGGGSDYAPGGDGVRLESAPHDFDELD